MARGSKLAAACLAVAALAGCGGPGRRAAVNRYLNDVDRIERSFAPELARVQRAYDGFGHGRVFGAESLTGAAAAFARLRAQVARLVPPPDARPLHRDLLRLLTAETRLGREVAALDRYLRAANAPLGRLRTAEVRLRSGLGGARAPARQEALFAAFAAGARTVSTQLGRVAAPPALTGWRRSELARVARLRGEALAIRDALVRRDAAALRPRLARLQADLGGREVVVAERAAVQAYDARAAAVRTLAGRVDAERARLERRLG